MVHSYPQNIPGEPLFAVKDALFDRKWLLVAVGCCDVVVCCEVKERSSCGNISQLNEQSSVLFRPKSNMQKLPAVFIIWHSRNRSSIFNKILFGSQHRHPIPQLCLLCHTLLKTHCMSHCENCKTHSLRQVYCSVCNFVTASYKNKKQKPKPKQSI